MKNSNYHTHDVKKICENKLEIIFKKITGNRSDHFNGWFYFEGKKSKRITISKGRKPIPPKTYSSMAKQLGLNTQQFDSLLECPLTLNDYKKIICS
jgi:hypothetical protein